MPPEEQTLHNQCCPDCGGIEFSWTAEIREYGTVESTNGEVNLYRSDEQGEVNDVHFNTLYCETCNTHQDDNELISQDEAYDSEELEQPWMDEYTVDGRQETLADK